jgi:hypothetical protein
MRQTLFFLCAVAVLTGGCGVEGDASPEDAAPGDEALTGQQSAAVTSRLPFHEVLLRNTTTTRQQYTLDGGSYSYCAVGGTFPFSSSGYCYVNYDNDDETWELLYASADCNFHCIPKTGACAPALPFHEVLLRNTTTTRQQYTLNGDSYSYCAVGGTFPFSSSGYCYVNYDNDDETWELLYASADCNFHCIPKTGACAPALPFHEVLLRNTTTTRQQYTLDGGSYSYCAVGGTFPFSSSGYCYVNYDNDDETWELLYASADCNFHCIPATQSVAYDASLGAPRCGLPSDSCDSEGLLNGRGPLGPEPNAPNTVDTCVDAVSGTYHSDESLDRLKVSTLDGSPLKGGKSVRIEATVWAFSNFSADFLDLYYAADALAPSWNYIGTLGARASGSHLLATVYTLPSGTARSVIRGVFRFADSAGTCPGGDYTDVDDLVFNAQ